MSVERSSRPARSLSGKQPRKYASAMEISSSKCSFGSPLGRVGCHGKVIVVVRLPQS